MTSVYGVTFIGAREQIASRLRERGFPWQDWAELCKLSTYAAQVGRASWQSLYLHQVKTDVMPAATLLHLRPSCPAWHRMLGHHLAVNMRALAD